LFDRPLETKKSSIVFQGKQIENMCEISHADAFGPRQPELEHASLIKKATSRLYVNASVRHLYTSKGSFLLRSGCAEM
jgi:hypothetical protein